MKSTCGVGGNAGIVQDAERQSLEQRRGRLRRILASLKTDNMAGNALLERLHSRKRSWERPAHKTKGLHRCNPEQARGIR